MIGYLKLSIPHVCVTLEWNLSFLVTKASLISFILHITVLILLMVH